MLILLEVLAAAFLSFLATWFFLKKQIKAQIDLSITAYDRGSTASVVDRDWLV
jgi:hypothetical protein